MDRFGDMALFVKVADCRSFTKAAEKLGLSKSVVSRRLTELENRLGARLLNRTTRHLSLTEVGLAFYERALRILADVDEAERSVGSLGASPRGVLRVNAPVSFAMRHLAPAIANFMRQYPEIEIEMEMNDRYVDLVDEGYDLAIRVGRLKDSSLIARRIAPSHRAVVGSPAYLREHGAPKTPEDLLRHNCLIYSYVPVTELWQFRMPDGGLDSIRVSGSLRVNNGEFLVSAAIAGLGLAFLPTFICGEAISRGELEVVLADYTFSEAAIQAVYPHNRHLSTKVRTFVDFLAGRFGPTPYWDEALHVLASG